MSITSSIDVNSSKQSINGKKVILFQYASINSQGENNLEGERQGEGKKKPPVFGKRIITKEHKGSELSQDKHFYLQDSQHNH